MYAVVSVLWMCTCCGECVVASVWCIVAHIMACVVVCDVAFVPCAVQCIVPVVMCVVAYMLRSVLWRVLWSVACFVFFLLCIWCVLVLVSCCDVWCCMILHCRNKSVIYLETILQIIVRIV